MSITPLCLCTYALEAKIGAAKFKNIPNTNFLSIMRFDMWS